MKAEDVVPLDEQLSKAHSSKRMFEELMDDPKFKHLIELVDTQVKNREHEVLVMPGGLDDVIKRIYSSGEIAGMKIVVNLPNIMVETLKENIQMINRQLDAQNNKEM